MAADKGGKEVKKVFTLSIKESRLKLFYLGSFVVVLFLFGFMAGRLFTHGAQES
ncbi:MAG: hypothetical protein ACE5HC_10680 [Candidatus Binatia bacterium]